LRAGEDGLFYTGAGPMAAILLGAALVPLRELTTASNLAFAFMALTIVVAEFGGRAAAVATALVSALSLDFFLTRPYLRLSIEDNHDVIAFLGLAVCGLVAAALGSDRGARLARLSAVERSRDAVREVLRVWDPAGPLEPQLAAALRAAREAAPIAGAAVRDEQGRLLASAQPADGARPAPATLLRPDSLFPEAPESGQAPWSFALPAEGGRIVLAPGGRRVGTLDVWGDGSATDGERRSALADVARLVGLLLATRAPES
jgi:hypothetical protein